MLAKQNSRRVGHNKQFTVRNVPAEVAQRLQALSQNTGRSLNATLLAILGKAVDLDERRQRLARYATWTETDFDEFSAHLRQQRHVHAKL